MAIRLRKIDNEWYALCAACTDACDNDIYFDDNQHYALADKFGVDACRDGVSCVSVARPRGSIEKMLDVEQ